MNKKVFIIIGVVVAIGVGYWLMNQKQEVFVTNFEECIAAGNPAMESYPRQCRHGDQTFIEIIQESFKNDELGISFNYPPNFGESNVIIAEPGKRPGGETGRKIVGSFSQFSALEFGGITDDFTAGREGLITDTRGFIEENGQYYFKFVSNKDYKDYEIQPLKVLEKDFGKILILNDQSFKAEREWADGPVFGVGNNNLAGLVNLKGEEFPGLVFYNTKTDEFSLEDFESLLDSMVVYYPEDTTATSADNAPPGSIHNLPVPDAVAAVRTKIANDLGVQEGLVIIMTAYEKTWSDSCLGLGGPAESCLAAITQGYEVSAEVQGQSFTYHTNGDGSVLREKK